MNLKITKQAIKFCNTLDAKQYRQVHSAILGLLSNPQPHDSQPLKGASNGERRLDVGEYRIIYAVGEELVDVMVVGKRNDDDVYKLWERMK
ncbi:type II toxin-antitoxin system RelE/ParE family toxin [Cupriavidus sp. CuC1]|uniref:type II toxin-antitoxin system RelE/ParE family toxin n=1 Tax=Cupriavidus sp. CuC1 TaxID=3373131 RepID=UPI0037D0E295